MRITPADAFIEALEAQGVTVDQVEGSIYKHEEINAAIGQVDEVFVTEPLIEFMTTCFEL